MNYGHAYHAGNHTEVFKHSVLCLLLSALLKKSKPFTVLDTHAGAGLYDLQSVEAQKTGEARGGIGRVFDKHVPAAAGYLDLVRKLNPTGLRRYPGSPAIVQAYLREQDRLIACDLHKEVAGLLRTNFRNDARISVHHRDGYEALKAFVPLPTKRGLVFIDPPFERTDEFQALAEALNSGLKKWPTGIYAAWYPIKSLQKAENFRSQLSIKAVPTLCCELMLEPAQDEKLVGSGILICNPPWRFEQAVQILCEELLRAFEASKGCFSLKRWVTERRK